MFSTNTIKCFGKRRICRLISKASFIMFLAQVMCYGAFSQVVISGTTFQFDPERQSDTYIELDNVLQYGVALGNLTSPLNLPPPGALLTTFKNTSAYVVAKNPLDIDAPSFINYPKNGFIYSVANGASPQSVLEYAVGNMEPNTPVSVTIEYAAVADPVKVAACNNQQAQFKAWVNPDYTANPPAGIKWRGEADVPQIAAGTTTGVYTTPTNTNTYYADPDGRVVVRIQPTRSGSCYPTAITKIEVKGMLKVTGFSVQGLEVCAKELITLQSATVYAGTYLWKYRKAGASVWTNLGSNATQSFEAIDVANYEFQYEFTPTGSTSKVLSNIIPVSSIACCSDPVTGAASSRQTIYYDNFGTLTDLTGNSFKVWDYSDPNNPKEITVPSDAPYRLQIDPAPLGTTFQTSGPIMDRHYAVVANMTDPLLGWAKNITGMTPPPQIGYDHSGTREGGALLINVPDVIGPLYERTFPNLCISNGSKIYFECYVTVFTPEDNGVDITVRLDGGNGVVTENVKVGAIGDANPVTGKKEGWVRLAKEITLNATNPSLKMEIINNSPIMTNGNDLVIDDIKILACAPPPLDLVFNKTTMSKDTLICKDRQLVTVPTANFKKFYNDNPTYIYQWASSPTASPNQWTTFAGPIPGVPGEAVMVADPKTLLPTLQEGDKIYFRVVAGKAGLTMPASGFNKNNPCRDYSVSDAIVGTYKCPACAKPTKVTITNGTTVVTDGGTVTICEGSALALKIAAEWPLVTLADKNVELYRQISSTKDSVLKTIDGSVLDKGDVTFNVVAANVKPSLAGVYTFGAKNTSTCRLESSLNLVVNKKILNNSIVANDTICAGGKPLGFKQDPNKAISGDLASPAYQWQSGATENGTFTNIASATAENYLPTAPNTTTQGTYYYKRIALAKKSGSSAVCADSVSKPVVLVVQPPISGNTIALASNPVCSGKNASFTGSTITGASFQWLQSTTTTGPWTTVSSATQKDLNVTVNKSISPVYYFRRIAKLGKCADTTAPTKVDVIEGMDPGEIERSQTICNTATSISPFTSKTDASGGTGTGATYQWQSRTSETAPWANISAATAKTYSEPTAPSVPVTYFRRVAMNGSSSCDTAYSNVVKITVVTPSVAVIDQPFSVSSPASESTTTRNPSIWIHAKDPGTSYSGTWTITNGAGTGLKNGNLKALGDSLMLLAFGQTTTAIWTVQDTAKVCPEAKATLLVIRKNFTLPDAGSDDTICITNVVSYKLKGNAYTPGDERGYWELVSPSAGLSVSQTNSLDSTEATITVPGPGVYEFRYRIVNPVLNEDNVDIVRIKVDGEVLQPTLPRPDTSICVTELQLDANLDNQPTTAIGTWKPATGQVFSSQVIEAPNDPKSMLTSIPTSTATTVTNLTWEVKNGVCPVKSVDFTVNQVGLLSNPTISLNGTRIRGTDTTLCYGVAYTLTTNTVLSNESGAWKAVPGGSSISIPGGNATSQAVTINQEGNTDVTWTMSKLSCPDAPRTVTLNVFKAPNLQPLTGSPVCEDQSGTYFAKSVMPSTNDTLVIDAYNWYTTSNTPSGSKGTATVQGAANTATGIFKFNSLATTGTTDKATVFVTATNACGVSSPQSLEITIQLKPRDFTGSITGLSPICESSTVSQTYAIPLQTNTTIHNWLLDGTPLAVLSQPALEATIPIADLVSTTATKNVVVQLENVCGKGVSDTFEIVITPAIPVVAKLSGYDTVCLPRDGFTYTGSSTNAGTNPTYIFTIQHADGSFGKNQGPDLSNVFQTAVGDLRDGSKIKLEIIGDSLTGCFTTGSGTDVLTIDGYEYPDTTVVLHTNDTVCVGNDVQFCIDNKKKGNTTYTWYKDSDLVKASGDNCIILTATIQSGLYTVKIDNLVCDSRTSGQHRARIYDNPTVRFVPEEILMEISVLPDFTLVPEITGLTSDTLTHIKWSPADNFLAVSGPLSRSAIFTPPPLGGQFMYSIALATGEGAVQCWTNANIRIFALPPVKVPNAFSPNGDGLNELWQIDGIEAYPRAKVTIFNRWGNKIFDASPYNGQNGWDGLHNGAKIPTGTYYYVIDLAENVVIQSRYLTGSLTIVR